MSERLWDTLTFAAVGLPAVVFAIGKAYLAFLMYRGTRIRTPLGLWLMRLYAVVAMFSFAIGIAYLLTVSDRAGWLETQFLAVRQLMRIGIGLLYLLGIGAGVNLWKEVERIEAQEREREP